MSYRQFTVKIWKDFIRNRKGKYFLGILFVFLTNLMQILAPKNIGWIVDFFANKPVPSILTGKSNHQTFIILFSNSNIFLETLQTFFVFRKQKDNDIFNSLAHFVNFKSSDKICFSPCAYNDNIIGKKFE